MKAIRGIILCKFMVVEFRPKIEDSFSVTIDGVSISSNISMHDPRSSRNYSIVEAEMKLTELPIRDKNDRIVIRRRLLDKIDHSIQLAVDMMTVSDHAKSSSYSPRDFIALKSTTRTGKTWLRSIKSLYLPPCSARVITPRAINLSPDIITALDDRTDGLRLMADAISQNSSIGAFNGYLRVFERAFGVPFTSVASNLNNFLDPQFEYNVNEITKWRDLRGRAFHTDVKKSDKLAYDRHVRDVVSRVEQAAYDVLINKKKWRSSDTSRVNRWFPNVGTVGEKSDIFLTQGLQASIPFQPMDNSGREMLIYKIEEFLKKAGK